MNWANKKVLITAGPTQEPIDPVRYITNHSTGKMGYALAEQLAEMKANVYLVSGPTALPAPENVSLIGVITTEDMYKACEALFDTCDIAIFAAAVADYKPVNVATQKIKKDGERMSIELEKTIDIASTLGDRKKEDQLTVGFALETDNEEFNAREKLEKKKFDVIVLNSLRDEGAGFGYDTNKVTLISHNKTETFELKSKWEVAKDIICYIEQFYAEADN